MHRLISLRSDGSRCWLSVCSGVVVVNPSSSQLIQARDELIMMRPTAIGRHKYQGSPVPVATVDIGVPHHRALMPHHS